MKFSTIIVLGAVLVAAVFALTVAITAAAPWIALGVVILAIVGWMAVSIDKPEPPQSGPSGPPAVD
jgi:hypothetical protein